jgi:hypothetical protein
MEGLGPGPELLRSLEASLMGGEGAEWLLESWEGFGEHVGPSTTHADRPLAAEQAWSQASSGRWASDNLDIRRPLAPTPPGLGTHARRRPLCVLLCVPTRASACVAPQDHAHVGRQPCVGQRNHRTGAGGGRGYPPGLCDGGRAEGA